MGLSGWSAGSHLQMRFLVLESSLYTRIADNLSNTECPTDRQVRQTSDVPMTGKLPVWLVFPTLYIMECRLR